jgi:hypothetical protein
MTSDNLQIIVLILSIFIALALLYFLFSSNKLSGRNSVKQKAPPSETKTGRPCPLCGELLTNGEKVHSVIYPGKPDKLMEIYGCPHCKSTSDKRRCPVCKKIMDADYVLIARVFEKPGKTHVHVLGCSGCYSGRSRPPKEL